MKNNNKVSVSRKLWASAAEISFKGNFKTDFAAAEYTVAFERYLNENDLSFDGAEYFACANADLAQIKITGIKDMVQFKRLYKMFKEGFQSIVEGYAEEVRAQFATTERDGDIITSDIDFVNDHVLYQDIDPDIVVVQGLDKRQRKLIRAEVPGFLAAEKAELDWWVKILDRCYEVGYLSPGADDLTEKIVFLYKRLFLAS